MEKLWAVCLCGDIDEARRLVAEGRANPEAVNKFGNTLLHRASARGLLPVMRYLVEEVHVDVEKTANDGCTALHLACSLGGRLSLVQYLVEVGGANIEARDDQGNTPLHHASPSRYKDIVHYLVAQCQANVNAKNKCGETPLEHDPFLKRPEEEIIRYLLPSTISVNISTLEHYWERDELVDIRSMVLEKYIVGQGLKASAFRRNPIHTLLSQQLPFPTGDLFKDCVELFPSSVLSILDEQGRLSIHVALASTNKRVRTPSVISFLFEREPRSALARDPTKGLYPHETAAILVSQATDEKKDETALESNDSEEAYYETNWLDIVYRMFRSNPEKLLQSRPYQK